MNEKMEVDAEENSAMSVDTEDSSESYDVCEICVIIMGYLKHSVIGLYVT